jgi:hypothetical protein
VALPFVRVDGGLAPGEAVECPYEAEEIRRAQAMVCGEANRGCGSVLAAGKSQSGRVRRRGDLEDLRGGAGRLARQSPWNRTAACAGAVAADAVGH